MTTILKFKEEMRGCRNSIYLAIVFFSCVFFVSCDNVEKEVKFDKAGNLEYLLFLKKGDTIKYFKSFDNGSFVYRYNKALSLLKDTIREYYENGNMMFEIVDSSDGISKVTNFTIHGKKRSEGLLFNNKNIGWWNYFENDRIVKRIYFTQVDNKILAPQMQFFDEKGKVNSGKSDFINLLIPDTVFVGRSTGTITYKKKLIGSQERIAIGYGLKPDYSNINSVRIDTFYNPKDEGFFGVEFDKIGTQTIRGFIHEKRIDIVSDTKAEIKYVDSHFEKTFFVVPRPDSIPKDKVIRYDNL